MDKLTDLRIGHLMVRRGVITDDQLQEVFGKQEENANLRMPSMIGEICVEEGWCTMADIAAIMHEQRDEVIKSNSLGSCLVEMGAITQDQLWEALEQHEEVFEPLGEIVAHKGFCTEDQVRLALTLQGKRRNAMTRRLVSSNLDPINVLEIVVNDEIDSLIAEQDGCFCTQCRSNVFAIALNKLPPRYVSNQDLILPITNRCKEEYSDLIRMHITKGVQTVKASPKLSCRMKSHRSLSSFSVSGEVLVKVSNRHVHLSDDSVSALFGPGYVLTPWKDLLQPGQYAAKEVVRLEGPKGKIENVRVLGPTRPQTQVEISGTDQFVLGINAPVRQSGDIEGTPGIVISNEESRCELDSGMIRAFRHIHMTADDGRDLHVKDRDLVNVRLMGDRVTVCEDVLVRISDPSHLEMHVDTDEANAAGVPAESMGMVFREQLDS
ncbi:MAG: phosphate propanoyltransferase [Desulfobacterales bacterium]